MAGSQRTRSRMEVEAVPAEPSRWPRRRIVRIAALVVTLLALVVALDGARIWTSFDRVQLELPGAGGGAVNYLLVGTDSREWVSSPSDAATFGTTEQHPEKRADLILILHLPESGTPTLLGIPRDLMVDYPREGRHRIALTYLRGPQLLVDTLCVGLGIGVDHVVEIGLDGFASLIDHLGGVEVDIPEPIRDLTTGLDVPDVGPQMLDGRQALAFVRSRHLERLVGDVWVPAVDQPAVRLANGQAVASALGDAIEGQGLWDQRSLATLAAETLVVDDDLGPLEMRDLRQAMTSIADRAGATVQLPVHSIEQPPPTPGLDPVPIDYALPHSAEVLDQIGAGGTAECPRPVRMPEVPQTSSLPPPSPPPTVPPPGPTSSPGPGAPPSTSPPDSGSD